MRREAMSVLTQVVNSSGAVTSTPVDTTPLDPSEGVEQTGNETIDGIKTFLQSPVIPAGDAAAEAVQFGQVVKNTGDESIGGNKTITGSFLFSVGGRLKRRVSIDIFEGVEVADQSAERTILIATHHFEALKFKAVSARNTIATVRIPDDYQDGQAIVLWLYWTRGAAGAGDVLWKLDHREVTPDTADVISTVTITESGGASAVPAVNGVKSQSIAVTAAGILKGDIMSVRIYRDPTDPLDTFGSDAYLVAADLEYVSDRLAPTVA